MTCRCHKTNIVRVFILPALSHKKIGYWKDVAVDRCLVPIVRILQNAGINMRGSCCGHGTNPGIIVLESGHNIKLER